MESRRLKDRPPCRALADPASAAWTRVGRLVHSLLSVVAGGLFLVYCLWWFLWLARGKLPPALFLAITGLPAPTTGFTRSLEALLAGNLRESLCWNPMSVPIVGLLIMSLGWLGRRFLRRERLRLPAGFLYAWIAVLVIAWAAKLLGNPAYW